jgi:trigger factor
MSSDTNGLKITVQEPQSWSRRLNITVPAERVKRTRSGVAAQIARNARIPGFRKGKLPTSVIEKRFGPSIEQETLDRLIQDAYREALQSQEFNPITQGKVDNVQYEPGADLVFEVEFEVRPEIQLERLSGFTITRPSLEVGEEDAESVIERLRDDQARWEPAEEGARPDYGDRVTVEITALDAEGQTQEGEEARSYQFVLGEGQAIPDVESAILTLQAGEEGEFAVKFPEDFPDEARRGEEQRLHIRLTEAQRKVLPEVDEEFARAVGDFDSVEALRSRILDDLRQDAEQRAEGEVRQQLLQSIVEANPFEVPDSMVERYLDYMTGHSHADGEQHNHTPEEEARLQQVRTGLRPQAELGLKRMLVVDRVAEQEGLQATQDEIDARVEELAARHERSASEVWLQLEKSGQLEALEREITEEKVFEHLKSQNTVA